jgi:two-component system, LytTR family, response regulator
LREPAPGPAEGKARTGYLFLKDGHKLVKVLVKDITYIEGLKDYVIVHTAGKRITILQSMKSIEEILSEKSFIRVHKSFIVSLEKIDAVEGNTIRIGNSSIPVGETYKAAFVEALRKNIL